MQLHDDRFVFLAKFRTGLAGAVQALVLGAGLILAGCSSDDQPPPPAPAAGTQNPDATGAPPSPEDVDEDPEAPRVVPPPAKDKVRNDIVARVDDQPISAYDLSQRIALIMVTSGIPNTPEMQKKVREQALEQLEMELIQRQEAQKNDITVSSVEVDKRIKDILSDSRLTMDQLKEILARGHVSMSSFRAQNAAQILWQKVVQMQFSGRINIAPETIEAELKRYAESANKPHYVVSEIFVAVDSPEQDAKARQDAENYFDQIRSGAPFAAVARQFSQSPSAAQGGNIGIVYDGQLAPELNKILASMKSGEISSPVRSIGGYYILALQQRLEPYGTKVETPAPEDQALPSTLPLARLLLPLPPKPSKVLAENALRVARTLVPHISGCKLLPKIAKEIQGSIYMDLGRVRLADLSVQIRDILAKTESGGVAAPFLSDAGVEVFVRCDKAIPKLQVFQMPTEDQIREQLFDEQMSALARRYSRDLRRNADVEVR